MSNDINCVILIGRLTHAPELKATNSGQHFCRFSLASNRSIYNKQSGESRDEVGYFDCIAWGKGGEAIHKYLEKGRRICIEGSLRWSSWEGTDGKKQSKTEINVNGFQFLDAKQGNGEQTEPASGVAHFDSGAMGDEGIHF